MADNENLTDEERAELEKSIREEVEQEIKTKLQEEHKETIDSLVDERLAKMKASMDAMDKKLKEAVAENTRYKDKLKETERKRLEDEGKHLELSEMKNAELTEQVKILQEKLTSMSRDSLVEKSVSGLDFRNDFARDTAIRTIIDQLEVDDDGNWAHKSGASIEDFVKVFVKDEKYEILFKPKENSGSGTNPAGGKSKKTNKPVSQMSTQELLKAAEEGALGDFSF